jgi:hypothetical protein
LCSFYLGWICRISDWNYYFLTYAVQGWIRVTGGSRGPKTCHSSASWDSRKGGRCQVHEQKSCNHNAVVDFIYTDKQCSFFALDILVFGFSVLGIWRLKTYERCFDIDPCGSLLKMYVTMWESCSFWTCLIFVEKGFLRNFLQPSLEENSNGFVGLGLINQRTIVMTTR